MKDLIIAILIVAIVVLIGSVSYVIGRAWLGLPEDDEGGSL